MCRTCALHSPARAVLCSSLSLRCRRLSTPTAGRSVLLLAAVPRRSERRISVECAASIQIQNRNPSTPRQNRWSLDGMTALLTGGMRCVGREVVEELVGRGARVHTCARNAGELQCCLSEWGERGYGISGSVCDVSITEQRFNLIEIVSSLFVGNLNILGFPYL